MIIISLITVICTWGRSGSSDVAFVVKYTVDNVATSFKLWAGREFLMCRRKVSIHQTSAQEAKNRVQLN